MSQMMFTVGLSGLLSLILLVALRPVAVRVRLMDHPMHRKSHKASVPLTGGLSIALGLSGAWIVTMPLSGGYGIFLLCSAALVCLGALDDARDLSPQLRLWIQAVLGALLTYGSGIGLTTLGDLLGQGDILLGWLGPLITMAAIIGATNAFNMIDGIDGLIGTTTLVALVGLLLLFARSSAGDTAEIVLAAAMAVAMVPYLMANLRVRPFRRTVFMGDAGAMFVGISLVWLFAKGSAGDAPALRPVTALWLVAVPLMDMVAIMIRRVRRGQSVLQADRQHLHHMFLRAGYSDRQALSMITALAAALAAFGVAGEWLGVPEWLMFALFLALFASYLVVLSRIWHLLVKVRRIRGRFRGRQG